MHAGGRLMWALGALGLLLWGWIIWAIVASWTDD